MLSGMDKTQFDIAVPWIFYAEGGLAEEVNDHGGTTKYGISLRYLRHVGDRDDDGYADGDLDHDGDVDGDDILIMTREEALAFYRQDFWEAARCGDMPPTVALTLFDARVNHRPLTAARLVQEALGVATDGRIGPVTIQAAHNANPQRYLKNHLGYRARLYSDLVAANSSQARFLRGWFNRLFALQAYILLEVS